MSHPASWEKLADLARRAPPEPAVELSPGFITRVAARGMAQRREPVDFLGAFALRALGVALAVMLVSAAVSYPLASHASTTDEVVDPVSEMVAQL
jgi:hypothetical protein